MARGIYFGVGSIARRAKKLYFGDKGTARKVKKVYLGLGGVPRLVYSGVPEKVENVTSLSVARAGIPVAYTGNYVVFAYGNNLYGIARAVEAYDTSLTHITLPNWTKDREASAGATIGEYACYIGGINIDTKSNYGSMIRYDSSLVRSEAGSAIARGGVGVARNTTYTFFVGGYTYNGDNTNIVESMSDNFVTSYLSNVARTTSSHYMMTVSTPNYAVFSFNPINVAYDTARVQHNFTSPDTINGVGATLKNYVLFAGGSKSEGISNEVAVYDSNLTKLSSTNLPVAVRNLNAVSRDGYALFSGGTTGFSMSDPKIAISVCFDSNLVRDYLQDLSQPRTAAACATIGDYAIFAGGIDQHSNATNVVDVYRF